MTLKDSYTPDELQAAIDAAIAAETARLAAEKEKLSAKVSKDDERFTALQSELSELRKFQKAADKEKADREKALAEAQRLAEEEKLSAEQRLEKRTSEWQQQLDAMRRQQEEQAAIIAKERQFNELIIYRERAIAAAAEDIEPRLLDFIGGSTKEEIDAAVEDAKVRTAAMFEDIRQAQVSGRAQMPGVRPGPPPVTDLDQPSSEGTLTGDQVRAMPWDEYAKFRQSRIPSTGQGIFG